MNDIKKYDYIDVLRAVAILGVIAVHSHQGISGLNPLIASVFNFGQLGVQLFFVASAITLCLSMEHRREDGYLNFYIRRFFRIAPLYYFGIILYFIWRVVVSLKTGNYEIVEKYSLNAILENIFFIHGFHPSNFNFVVPGGWSISVEMMFYLMFPFIFKFLKDYGISKFVLLSVFVALGSFLFQVFLISYLQPKLVGMGLIGQVTYNDEFGFMYASIINQINVFLIGVMGYYLIESKRDFFKSNYSILISLLLILFCIYLQNNRSNDTGLDGYIYPILTSVSFVVLSVKFSRANIPKNAIFNCLITVGKNSFSMYLMHFMVLDMTRYAFGRIDADGIFHPILKLAAIFLITTFFTYIFSIVTNKFIETKGIRFGQRLIN